MPHGGEGLAANEIRFFGLASDVRKGYSVLRYLNTVCSVSSSSGFTRSQSVAGHCSSGKVKKPTQTGGDQDSWDRCRDCDVPTRVSFRAEVVAVCEVQAAGVPKNPK